MLDYGEFVKKAIEEYKAMPEESDELYKRNYFTIPIDRFGSERKAEASEDEMLKVALGIEKRYGFSFDVVVCGGRVVSKGKGIEVYGGEEAYGKGYVSDVAWGGRLMKFMRAFSEHVVSIGISRGERDIGVLNMNAGGRSVVRFRIRGSGGAKLRVTELNLSSGSADSLSGIWNDAYAEEDSAIELNVINNQDENTYAALINDVRVERGARATLNSTYSGGLTTKASSSIYLEGEQAKGKVFERAYLRGSQRLDSTTQVTNAARDTSGAVDSRVIAGNGAEAILKGHATVEKGATGSTSHIYERGLTLDDDSKIETIPVMSVFEKDVKEAKHSAGVAPLSEDSVFYICSRGIDNSAARSFIIKSILMANFSETNSTFARILVPSILLGGIDGNKIGELPEPNIGGVWIEKAEVLR